MGYATILDIAGSILIGAMLLGIILKLNNTASWSIYSNAGELNCQTNLTSMSMMLENDFRKIDYCSDNTNIQDPANAILAADTTSIKFISDLNKDGKMDTVYYYLGPATELNSTANPRDKILYRIVNNAAKLGSDAGITRFYIVYYDVNGDTVHTPVSSTYLSLINDIELNMNIENTSVDSSQLNSYWRQARLTVPNIKHR
jgi:type II secretory pathway component PulJ